jgi:hypothetical protein
VPAGSTITCVSVALNGATSSGTGPFGSMRYASFMLTAPGGQRLEFLGATGDGTDGDDMRDSGSGLDGVNIAVWDGASSSAPYYPAIWPHTGSVPVKPSSYVNAPNNLEGVPPLGTSAQWAQTDGSATFTSQFVNAGATPNGNWALSLIS